MKTSLYLAVLVGAAALAANAMTEQYNDLGRFQGEENAFWNTKAHPPVAVESELSDGDNLNTDCFSTSDWQGDVDSWYYTVDIAVIEKFNSRPPSGGLIIVR